MLKQTIIALDLEMNQPDNEIISVGICEAIVFEDFGNLETSIVSSANYLITPTNPISGFITNLTGLTDDMYDKSVSRAECFRSLVDHLDSLQKFGGEFVTWGCGDVILLYDQVKKELGEVRTTRKCMDVKSFVLAEQFIKKNKFDSRTSLKTAMSHYDLTFTGQAHNSEADAVNTLKLFLEIANRRKRVNYAIEFLAEIGK